MLSKSRLKILQSLQLKKHRQKYNLFVGEGDKIALAALSNKPELIEEVICTEDWIARYPVSVPSVQVTLTDERTLGQLSSLRSQPSVAVVMRMSENVLNWSEIKHAMYLDDVQDPGNVGTIIRIADWYGVDAVIRSEGSADFYNSKCVQSTMGSLLNVQLHTMSQMELMTLKDQVPLYATAMSGSNIRTIQPLERSVLIMGHEGKGVSESLLKIADTTLTIEGHPQRVADSLNVAISTGILAQALYSFR